MKVLKFICLCLVISLLTACHQSLKPIQLRFDTYSLELGQPIVKKPQYYIDMESYNEAEKKEIIKNAKMTIDIKPRDIVTKDNKSYEKIGIYNAKIIYHETVLKLRIEIKDKTAPQIIGPDTVQLERNTEYDFENQFSAFDYDDIQALKIDRSRVLIKKEGSYFLEVKAIDMSGNENTKDVQVFVGQRKTKKRVKLDVPYYHQLEDANAPNGCEATSLYMALKYKNKIDIELKTFIENQPRSKTPYEGFFGDPFQKAEREDDYFAIFPSAFIPYGNQYAQCIDISHASLSRIMYELSLDRPVVAYLTGSIKEPQMKQYYFGKVTQNIHIVVLTGYDVDRKVFYVNEPMKEDFKEVSFDQFETSYNALQFAISIK